MQTDCSDRLKDGLNAVIEGLQPIIAFGIHCPNPSLHACLQPILAQKRKDELNAAIGLRH
eukprot:1156744-Pelagomonas_calceolata.AAC.3